VLPQQPPKQQPQQRRELLKRQTRQKTTQQEQYPQQGYTQQRSSRPPGQQQQQQQQYAPAPPYASSSHQHQAFYIGKQHDGKALHMGTCLFEGVILIKHPAGLYQPAGVKSDYLLTGTSTFLAEGTVHLQRMSKMHKL
jgi:hypothetical protein